jgi:hypothetical protein
LKNIQIFAEMKKKPHFNLKNDSYMKMSVAADQLSISTASPIETLTTLGVLPAEAIFTAEFVQKVYNFLDSLKSANSKPVIINALDVLCREIHLIWTLGQNY